MAVADNRINNTCEKMVNGRRSTHDIIPRRGGVKSNHSYKSPIRGKSTVATQIFILVSGLILISGFAIRDLPSPAV
jgi:hypothetical protein